MRIILAVVAILVVVCPVGCSSGRYHAPVVKPKYHHSRFDRKKDKRVKRTKVVKMKS